MSVQGSILLGVNVDHVATLRQARGTGYPDPVDAALLAESAGADSITVHLREDRRHIQDHDIERLTQALNSRMNLEMAMTDEMVAIAGRLRPFACCLVPEKRQELTTEGGLDIAGQIPRVSSVCAELAGHEVRVSLFVDPDPEQLDAAVEAGAPVVELHTGCFADALTPGDRSRELERVRQAAKHASDAGLIVHAGHGLNYENVMPVAGIDVVQELNIGHSIVSRAVFDGMAVAVAEMKHLMFTARTPDRPARQ